MVNGWFMLRGSHISISVGVCAVESSGERSTTQPTSSVILSVWTPNRTTNQLIDTLVPSAHTFCTVASFPNFQSLITCREGMPGLGTRLVYSTL